MYAMTKSRNEEKPPKKKSAKKNPSSSRLLKDRLEAPSFKMRKPSVEGSSKKSKSTSRRRTLSSASLGTVLEEEPRETIQSREKNKEKATETKKRSEEEIVKEDAGKEKGFGRFQESQRKRDKKEEEKFKAFHAPALPKHTDPRIGPKGKAELLVSQRQQFFSDRYNKQGKFAPTSSKLRNTELATKFNKPTIKGRNK